MNAQSAIDDLTDLFPPHLDTYQQIVNARTPNERSRKLLEAIASRGSTGRRRLVGALQKTNQDDLVKLLLGKDS